MRMHKRSQAENTKAFVAEKLRGLSVALTTTLSEKGGTFARELKSLGMRVHGSDVSKISRWLTPRYLDSYQYLSPKVPEERPKNQMLQWLRQIQPELFLPLDSPTVRLAIELEGELPPSCNTLLPPVDAFHAANNKSSCLQACNAMAIPTPICFTFEEAEEWLRRGRGSVVIKPNADHGAAKGVFYATCLDELADRVEQCKSVAKDYTLQEYIPGDDESYCSLTVLFDKRSRLIGASTMKKTISWPVSGGLNAVGVSTYQPELLDLMLPLFRRWRWVGGAEVEFRIDQRDGLPKVFEINPRFPGMTMFQCFTGVCYPLLAAQAACDIDPLPAMEGLSQYQVGIKCINLSRTWSAFRSLGSTHGYRKAYRTVKRHTQGGGPFLVHQCMHLGDMLRRVTLRNS